MSKIKTILNTILFLTGEVKVIKFIKYFTIILSFIGLTLSTAYADPKKVRNIVKYFNKLIILKTSPV